MLEGRVYLDMVGSETSWQYMWQCKYHRQGQDVSFLFAIVADVYVFFDLPNWEKLVTNTSLVVFALVGYVFSFYNQSSIALDHDAWCNIKWQCEQKENLHI